MKINWPTAIMLSVLVTAYVVLDALDKDIPHWLMTVAAAMGTGVAAAMDRLFKEPETTTDSAPSRGSDTHPTPPTDDGPPSTPEAA